jgi:hypothetical protein
MSGTLFCIVPNKVYLCVIKVINNQKQLKTTIMNTQQNNLVINFTKTKTEGTLNSQKECMETSNFHCNKTFTSADLWNIQRQGKTRTQRRFL